MNIMQPLKKRAEDLMQLIQLAATKLQIDAKSEELAVLDDRPVSYTHLDVYKRQKL